MELRRVYVAAAAAEVRQRLKNLGLESFLKLTGGKGLHVVTPLAPGETNPTWPEAKSFAQTISKRNSNA